MYVQYLLTFFRFVFVCLFVCLLSSILNDLKWCFGLPANLQSCLQHIRGCANSQLGSRACLCLHEVQAASAVLFQVAMCVHVIVCFCTQLSVQYICPRTLG